MFLERNGQEAYRIKASRMHLKLEHEDIEIYVSSPYERAIQTIKDAAGNNEILLFEDLMERL